MSNSMKGWIDVCSQTSISGWTTAPWVEVYANGEMLCRVESGGARADLIAAGIKSGRTFHAVLSRPLWLNDRVVVRLPDDSFLCPDERASHLTRLDQLLFKVDLSKPGLEFGPLNRPIVPRGRASVYYVDHDDRAGLQRKYAAGLGDDIYKFLSIDFVWSEGRSLNEIVKNQKFGWVIASHVGEHVADFIGWLGQLADVLEEGGRVSLALPHRDRTFDACRPLSTFADLVAAHIMRLVRPSAHQVLGHMLGVSEFWKIDSKKPENLDKLNEAIDMAIAANSGAYVDVHCSVFTPDSFKDFYSLIERSGLAKLKLESVAEDGGEEFFVCLTK